MPARSLWVASALTAHILTHGPVMLGERENALTSWGVMTVSPKNDGFEGGRQRIYPFIFTIRGRMCMLWPFAQLQAVPLTVNVGEATPDAAGLIL